MMSRDNTIRFVYIAGPYSNGDREANVRAALGVADTVMEYGAVPYVPMLCHYWHAVSPHPYEAWMELDLAWLSRCDTLIRIPGHSPGADREVEYARAHGIRVLSLLDWWSVFRPIPYPYCAEDQHV